MQIHLREPLHIDTAASRPLQNLPDVGNGNYANPSASETPFKGTQLSQDSFMDDPSNILPDYGLALFEDLDELGTGVFDFPFESPIDLFSYSGSPVSEGAVETEGTSQTPSNWIYF